MMNIRSAVVAVVAAGGLPLTLGGCGSANSQTHRLVLRTDFQTLSRDTLIASQSGDFSNVSADCANLGRDIATYRPKLTLYTGAATQCQTAIAYKDGNI